MRIGIAGLGLVLLALPALAGEYEGPPETAAPSVTQDCKRFETRREYVIRSWPLPKEPELTAFGRVLEAFGSKGYELSHVLPLPATPKRNFIFSREVRERMN